MVNGPMENLENSGGGLGIEASTPVPMAAREVIR